MFFSKLPEFNPKAAECWAAIPPNLILKACCILSGQPLEGINDAPDE
jgi:hypothetical protein